MSIYLANGYLDFSRIDNPRTPIQVCIGGRGCGKTYGVLKYYFDAGKTIAYVRRTNEQTFIASRLEFSPYKAFLCAEECEISRSKPKMLTHRDRLVAVFFSLSTMANVRGFSAENIDAIIYDEFIPELHERRLKYEYEALQNGYETINRNREIDGKPPVKLWLLSNSNTIESDILYGLGIQDKCVEMQKRGQETSIDSRGIAITMPLKSPILESKRTLGISSMASKSYKEMAYNNAFIDTSCSVVSKKLTGYVLYVMVGSLCIYRPKNGSKYYITKHKSGVPLRVYRNDGKEERKRFLRLEPGLCRLINDNWVEYEKQQYKTELEQFLS